MIAGSQRMPIDQKTFRLRPTLLLVAADAAAVESVTRMVAASEFVVQSAVTVSAAVQRLSRPEVDVVVVDLDSIGNSWLQLIESVQARAPQVPVIVLTTAEDPEIGAATLRKGARDFILKRFLSREVLLRTIRRHRTETA